MRRMLILLPAVLMTVLATLTVGCGMEERRNMERLLAEADSMNRNYINFTTDSVMLAVVDYYDRCGTPNERMKAHYLLGCVYRDLEEAPKALASFCDAIDCADTVSNDCDLILLCKIHGQATEFLLNLQLPYEALVESNNAYKIANQARDTLMVLHCLAQRVHALYLIGNMDSVVAVSETVSKEFLRFNNVLYSLISLKPAICAYLEMGQMNDAKRLIDKFEVLNYNKDSGVVEQSLKYFNAIKGQYYLKTNQPDSARFYYEKSDGNAIDNNEKLIYLRELARYYTQMGIADSALKYSEEFVKMDYTVYRTSVRRDFQKMHALYYYEKNKRLAEQKSRELSELKSQITTIALLLLVIGALVAYTMIRKKRKMDDENKELNMKYTNSLEQYSHLKNETELLEQSKEANEILIAQLQNDKGKNEETIATLNSKIEKYKVAIRQNKDDIKKQEYIIASFQKDKIEPEKWDMEEHLFNLPLLKRLHTIIAKGQQPSDRQIEEVHDMIEKLHPEFIPKIQELYPGINHVNMTFCIFTKLRFINSERAVIFNMSSQAVTNRSAFLYKKFTGKKGGAGDFEKEIQKI